MDVVVVDVDVDVVGSVLVDAVDLVEEVNVVSLHVVGFVCVAAASDVDMTATDEPFLGLVIDAVPVADAPGFSLDIGAMMWLILHKCTSRSRPSYGRSLAFVFVNFSCWLGRQTEREKRSFQLFC